MESLQNLIKTAKSYLLSLDGVSEQMINDHLEDWKEKKSKPLPEIYKSLLQSARNRQAMPNVIGDVDRLRNILFDFDNKKVVKEYGNYLALLDALKRVGVINSAIDVTNNRNLWVIYAKSAISSAKFISEFQDSESFHGFVESFYSNEHSLPALPLLIKENVFGF